MIPRAKRLAKKKEQDTVRSLGVRKHGRFFILYARSAERPRYAVSVSRAISTSSVERGRIRRAAQAALLADEKTDMEVVVIAKKEAANQKGTSLQKDINETLKQIS